MNYSLKSLTTNAHYWWLMLLIGLAMEVVALTYQYLLDYGPCPLCIHLRIGVLGFLLVSALALLIRSPIWWRMSHAMNIIVFAWLSERAYWLLGTEKGFVFFQCGLDAELPIWFALDKWLPALFEPRETCGYTPSLLFGITMAEVSIVLFPLMLLISLALLVISIRRL